MAPKSTGSRKDKALTLFWGQNSSEPCAGRLRTGHSELLWPRANNLSTRLGAGNARRFFGERFLRPLTGPSRVYGAQGSVTRSRGTSPVSTRLAPKGDYWGGIPVSSQIEGCKNQLKSMPAKISSNRCRQKSPQIDAAQKSAQIDAPQNWGGIDLS